MQRFFFVQVISDGDYIHQETILTSACKKKFMIADLQYTDSSQHVIICFMTKSLSAAN